MEQVFEGVYKNKKVLVYAKEHNAKAEYFLDDSLIEEKKYSNWSTDTGSKRPAIMEALNYLKIS